MPPDEHEDATLSPSLMRALRHLLRPLVRLLIRHQVTYPVLLRMLKATYLDEAEAEIAREGARRTASRISLVTGIHRKDVRRLSENADARYAPPASVSLGARIVAQWSASPFVDATGAPRPLPYAVEGDDDSFESLVSSVSTDIRPRAVLDEWLRMGVAEMDADGFVTLSSGAFVPSRGFDEKAHYFGRNLHDHIAAGVNNLDPECAPMLERSVYYDGLSEESVAELGRLAEKTGMEAIQSVNRRARELQERDAQRPERARSRMNFGAYFYRTEVEGDEGNDD